MCLSFNDEQRYGLYSRTERLFLVEKEMLLFLDKEKQRADLYGSIYQKKYDLAFGPAGLQTIPNIEKQNVTYSSRFLLIEQADVGTHCFSCWRDLGFHLSKFVPENLQEISNYFKSIFSQFDNIEDPNAPNSKLITLIVGFLKEDFMDADEESIVVRSFTILKPKLWEKVLLGYLQYSTVQEEEKRVLRKMIVEHLPRYEKLFSWIENSTKN